MRETFISLWQWGFATVPPPTRSVLMTIFSGYSQTAVCENAFNVCVDHKRDQKHAGMSRVARYMWPHTEKVLDQFNRAEVVPDPQDRCGKRRLPDGAFDAMAGGEPVLDKKFKDIMERDGWASPSPHTFNLSVAAFQLLLSVHRSQKWAEVGNAWKAVFFMTPMIVAFAPGDNVYVALDSSPYGLWLWPCERRTTDFMATIVVSTSPTSAPLFKPVFDFKDWQVIGVKPSTPLSIRHGGSRAGVSDCIHMRVVGSPEDVLVYAAEHAFGDATDHWLGALMNYLGLRCDSGSNEWTLMAKIDTLVRHLLPGISDDEVAAILAMRAKTRKATSGEQLATSMRNGGMQAMDTVCDPSDKQAWEKEADSIDFDPALVEKLLAYFATRKYKVPPSLEKADMVAKKKVAVQRVTQELTREKVRLTKANCKKYLPKRTDGGVILQPYPDKCRVQVYYPTREPPFSHTVRYGKGGFSEPQALAAAIGWAWMHHTAQTGQCCPYQFD